MHLHTSYSVILIDTVNFQTRKFSILVITYPVHNVLSDIMYRMRKKIRLKYLAVGLLSNNFAWKIIRGSKTCIRAVKK